MQYSFTLAFTNYILFMNLKNVFLFGCISLTAFSSCEKEVIDDPSTGGGGTVSADVTLIAGSPGQFASVDHANPLNARFYDPKKLLWHEKTGALYILDASGTTYLRKLDQNGVSTVAPYTFGLHNEAFDIALAPDAAGSLLVTTSLGKLMKLDPTVPVSVTNPSIIIDRLNSDGFPKEENAVGSLDVASIDGGYGLAVIDANTLYFSSSYLTTIRKVNFADVGNEVSAFAGKPTSSVAAPAWPLANGIGEQATFGEINDMTSDGNGNVYVADPGYVVLRKITPSGHVSSFLTPTSNTSSYYLNQDGTLTTAKANNVNHVAVSRDGKRLFFATPGSLRLALLDEDRVITLAQFKESINGIAVTPDGKTVFISSNYAIYKADNIKF
jgi:sugar lactone lactonase YvrE